ncbi:hypothetical protein [Sulfitobacter donghicola]|uniref:Sulfotransferase family protein n=1 Tax=Sulfitobacter donghicola DSW-25 = KCTC 12864 = JCM 14565 TaxID=1300350 RepID=A0A073IK12_9RHOB|nr:hypothetical protein [Sulfitobacter donghicola]KEJ89920.1 hypothetical protein DSW25_06820 [Sulfitobacter donghicola DSW-25 = KCTC 12864 = JCM 14565]KIN66955.1 hypothetical protein Z948_659 [Sulfitobacter donghicola DSW-25 = KCTC 12864 = JCM 14565]
MDIILHLGAHRCGSTSFQHYLRGNQAYLEKDGTAVWEPRVTRDGLVSGLFAKPTKLNARDLQRRAMGRVHLKARRAEREGAKRLVMSDENVIGTPRSCIRTGELYPEIGERMARLDAAFKGQVGRVLLNVRSLDLWWSSAAAFTVGRGHPFPTDKRLHDISNSKRTWKDVVTDLACALPNAEIKVLPFEEFVGRSDKILFHATNRDAPTNLADCWLNRSPDKAELRAELAERGILEKDFPVGIDQSEGRWSPFDPIQNSKLREAYADDIMWLAAGADGLATLTEDTSRKRTGTSLSAGTVRKGQPHDEETDKRRLA